MLPARFRIRTIMLLIAGFAVLMVAVRVALHNPAVVGGAIGFMARAIAPSWVIWHDWAKAISDRKSVV